MNRSNFLSSPNLSSRGMSTRWNMISLFLIFALISSCKWELDGWTNWWGEEKLGDKKELPQWSYDISGGISPLSSSVTKIDSVDGGWDGGWPKKVDKLQTILNEHQSYGEEWAGEDFYEVVFNAKNHKNSYTNIRSIAKRIIERVATSSILHVWFDLEWEIDKWQSFSYEDENWLLGTLKTATTVYDWVQYVKIVFSPKWVKWAYNVGDAWYWFSWDIKICCSRPLKKWDRDWQYTVALNQWKDIDWKQFKNLVEQLLYGWTLTLY